MENGQAARMPRGQWLCFFSSVPEPVSRGGLIIITIIIIIVIISVGSRWDYAHGRGPGPAPGELGLSAAKRAIDNWYVGDGQVRR